MEDSGLLYLVLNLKLCIRIYLRHECEPGSFWTVTEICVLGTYKICRINMLCTVTSCSLVGICRWFGRTYSISLVSEGESRFLQNYGNFHKVTCYQILADENLFFYERFTSWECQRSHGKVFMTDQGKKKGIGRHSVFDSNNIVTSLYLIRQVC